jgi:hypothetical protein
MKKLVITLLFLAFGLSYAAAQHANVEKPLTQEQRMVQSNAKHKNGGRNADVSKKVQRAKKQDRKARKTKSHNKKKPKR